MKDIKSYSDRELMENIFLRLNPSAEKSAKVKQSRTLQIYDNNGLKDLLHIGDKYLKKLRDNGYIGYSREGDKYWYTQEDVDRFLRKFHYDAFATNPDYRVRKEATHEY